MIYQLVLEEEEHKDNGQRSGKEDAEKGFEELSEE
jgi:hypothetical protein